MVCMHVCLCVNVLMCGGWQGPQPEAEEVADMRARICAGMKRYFHTKSIEGLLSNRVPTWPSFRM